MKAQVAFEYMIIIAVVLAFVMPLWAYNLSVQKQANTELSLAYSKNLATKIVGTADLVSSQGPPAKISIQVFIPEGVEEINISGNRVNLKVKIDTLITDVFDVSEATLNGTLPSVRGNYLLSVEARDGYVQITPQI